MMVMAATGGGDGKNQQCMEAVLGQYVCTKIVDAQNKQHMEKNCGQRLEFGYQKEF